MSKHYPNKGKKWTQQEVEQAFNDITELGFSVNSVAKKHGRPPSAIVSKLGKECGLGMTEPSDWGLGK